MFVVIPRKDIHNLALLGIFYGAVIDIFWIIVIRITGAGGYLNYGPLAFKGVPFMPPIAWTVFFIMFLFFLPGKKPWNYLFAAIAAGYSVFFSNVLSNLGIFHWTFSKVLFPFGLYLTWTLFVTWSYAKYGKKFIQDVIMKRKKLKYGYGRIIKAYNKEDSVILPVKRLKKPEKIR
jgi:hypothetical protein